MKGMHHVIVSNGSMKYEFDIKRNITILKGDSATGKTTLVEMIQEYLINGMDIPSKWCQRKNIGSYEEY